MNIYKKDINIAINKKETGHLICILLLPKSVTFWEVKVLHSASSTPFILLFEGYRKNSVKNKIMSMIEIAKKNWHFT